MTEHESATSDAPPTCPQCKAQRGEDVVLTQQPEGPTMYHVCERCGLKLSDHELSHRRTKGEI